MENQPLIMTPDHPDFSAWLSVPPPNAIAHAGKNDDLGLVALTPSGILECVTERQLDELIQDAGLFGDE